VSIVRPEITGRRRGTLKQLGAHLRSLGFPISDSALEKRTMPSRNDGPPVYGWFGSVRIFDFDEAEAWAENRLRPTNPKGPGRPPVSRILEREAAG
jgi:hypothetical protein